MRGYITRNSRHGIINVAKSNRPNLLPGTFCFLYPMCNYSELPMHTCHQLRKQKPHEYRNAECCNEAEDECERCQSDNCDYPDDRDDDNIHFYEPGSNSSLRATNVIERYNPNTGTTLIYHEPHGCHARVSHKDSFCKGCGEQLNQKNQRCPTCNMPDCLTAEDRQLGYQCNGCADAAERGMDRDVWYD